ncbi:MAG TPA: hypothetical protein VI731_12370 [Bacteroidia bacterium]|nr:hypothetical protein [Bacteroidia bacterium]
MKASADLFDLIKSLTKSEKRFFKLFAGLQEGEKNYLRLFDGIDRQGEYDEETLRRELDLRHISFEKNYLYKLILKSLRNFHSEFSIKSQLSDLLRNVEILHSKGLYRQCEKKLNKCKKLAKEHEQYHISQEILKWESTLLFNTLSTPDIVNRSKYIYNEQEELLKKTRNIIDFDRLSDQIAFMAQKSGATRTEAEDKVYERLLKHPLLKEENCAITEKTKKQFYYIHAMAAIAVGDTEKGYQYRKKHLEMVESKMESVRFNLANYIYVLNNFGWACLLTHRYDEVAETVAKLRNIGVEFSDHFPPALEARVFVRVYILDLFNAAKRGDFNYGVTLIEEIEKELGKHAPKIDKTQLFLLHLAAVNICFGLSDPRKSLPWLNHILNTPDIELRQDFHCLSKILNLLIHFELGNADMIEHLLKSTYRFLARKHRLYRFEAALLQFIRRELSGPQDNQQLRGAFVRLKEALTEILQDTHEKNVLWYFDFVSWLESKIENRPFSEIVREKFRAADFAA